MADRFLRLPDVQHTTGFGRAKIYLEVQKGTFPKPVKLGGRAVAWIESEVEAWKQARIAERDRVTEAA